MADGLDAAGHLLPGWIMQRDPTSGQLTPAKAGTADPVTAGAAVKKPGLFDALAGAVATATGAPVTPQLAAPKTDIKPAKTIADPVPTQTISPSNAVAAATQGNEQAAKSGDYQGLIDTYDPTATKDKVNGDFSPYLTAATSNAAILALQSHNIRDSDPLVQSLRASGIDPNKLTPAQKNAVAAKWNSWIADQAAMQKKGTDPVIPEGSTLTYVTPSDRQIVKKPDTGMMTNGQVQPGYHQEYVTPTIKQAVPNDTGTPTLAAAMAKGGIGGGATSTPSTPEPPTTEPPTVPAQFQNDPIAKEQTAPKALQKAAPGVDWDKVGEIAKNTGMSILGVLQAAIAGRTAGLQGRNLDFTKDTILGHNRALKEASDAEAKSADLQNAATDKQMGFQEHLNAVNQDFTAKQNAIQNQYQADRDAAQQAFQSSRDDKQLKADLAKAAADRDAQLAAIRLQGQNTLNAIALQNKVAGKTAGKDPLGLGG